MVTNQLTGHTAVSNCYNCSSLANLRILRDPEGFRSKIYNMLKDSEELYGILKDD